MNVMFEVVHQYYQLKSDFEISNKTMADWLGVKPRTLYSWVDQPRNVSAKNTQIESRLSELVKFKSEIEKEHVSLVYKIAFSPIFGEPQFGQDILDGQSSEVLIKWYEAIFSKFEAYRAVQEHRENCVGKTANSLNTR